MFPLCTVAFKISKCFWKKSIVLSKAVFIWSKIQ